MHLCNLMRWLISISSDISTNQGKITFILDFKNLIQSLYLVQREDFHFSHFQREDLFFFSVCFPVRREHLTSALWLERFSFFMTFSKKWVFSARLLPVLLLPSHHPQWYKDLNFTGLYPAWCFLILPDQLLLLWGVWGIALHQKCRHAGTNTLITY